MHGPVRRVALVRAVRVLLARDEQLHAHLLPREVVDREETMLVQELRVAAVDHRLAAEQRADAPRGVLEVDQPLLARQLEVERSRGAVSEGAGADGEGHTEVVAAARVQLEEWR